MNKISDKQQTTICGICIIIGLIIVTILGPIRSLYEMNPWFPWLALGIYPGIPIVKSVVDFFKSVCNTPFWLR